MLIPLSSCYCLDDGVVDVVVGVDVYVYVGVEVEVEVDVGVWGLC